MSCQLQDQLKNIFKIEDTDFGSVYFVTLTSDKRFTPICHECENKVEGIHAWHKRKIRNIDILSVECNSSLPENSLS